MPAGQALKVNIMSQQSVTRSWALVFLIIIFQVLPVTVKSQDLGVQQWREGKVVLTTGDTLAGGVVYHQKGELLQVELADGATKTYSPVNVASFTVFNEQTRRFQTFRSYRWSRRGDYSTFKTPAFFEVIAEGKYTLVEREALAIRNQDPVPRYSSAGRYYEAQPDNTMRFNGSFSQMVAVKQFYVLTPENEIVALRNPKKDLPDLFQDKAGAMQAFMKNRNLSYHNSTDLIPVIRHFNKL
jgi:hypothetical protein